jgi:hypothetical protein
VFSRAEALENEEGQIKALSQKLAAIPRTEDPALLEEARKLISKLHAMNKRWNVPELNRFLIERQKELFFS